MRWFLSGVARFGQTIDRADGFVIVTPEYNHGYPALAAARGD